MKKLTEEVLDIDANTGEMIVVSTPRSPSKQWQLAAAYGASVGKVGAQMYGRAIWMDECEGIYSRHKMWLTKDGDALTIDKMTDSHLQNSISMIESRVSWRRSFLIPMKKELVRRNTKLGELVYGELCQDTCPKR